MAERAALNRLVLVRIQVPQPRQALPPLGVLFIYATFLPCAAQVRINSHLINLLLDIFNAVRYICFDAARYNDLE